MKAHPGTIRTLGGTIAAAVLATAMAVAQSVTLPAGSTVYATLDTPIDTATASVGQRFTMHVTEPYSSSPLYGAYIKGHVIQVTHASQGIKPQLQLALDKLVLRNGSSTDISAQVTALETKQSGSNLGHAALLGVGGMIAGNVIGKTIFHSALGGPAGLAAGVLVGANAKVNFVAPQGAKVEAKLIHSLVVRRQAHR